MSCYLIKEGIDSSLHVVTNPFTAPKTQQIRPKNTEQRKKGERMRERRKGGETL
jgi:hypothetical protein